jgi:CcmD family protein
LDGLYQFLQHNAIYIVMIIVLIVWAGIFFYLLNLDKRLKSIQKEYDEESSRKSRDVKEFKVK